MIEPGVEQARSGFDEFYERHFSKMARLGVVMTGDLSLGEDLAQEAFVRVQPRFHQLEAPLAYTRRVSMNLCKRPRVTRRGAPDVDQHSVTVEDDQTASIDILDAVDRLPHRQRAVTVLRYYEDLPEIEIAQILGCRPGTVKSVSSRALARLRKDLRP